VLSTKSVAISTLVTTAVIIVAALLLAPLAPVFANPSVRIATANVLPACSGPWWWPSCRRGRGGRGNQGSVEGHRFCARGLRAGALSRVPIKGWEGVTILVLLPITILGARFLYKKGADPGGAPRPRNPETGAPPGVRGKRREASR
jgi:hypothetical protein